MVYTLGKQFLVIYRCTFGICHKNVNVTLSSIILLYECSAIRLDFAPIERIDTLAVGITVTDDATHIMELEVAVVERVADVLLGNGVLHPQQADGAAVQSLSEGKVEVALIEVCGKPPVVQTVLATLVGLNVARMLCPLQQAA